MPDAHNTYSEAHVAAREMLQEARLRDPGEHFPYKEAEIRALRDENPPHGRNGPDDDSFRAEDYTSYAIIEATAAYVEAQAGLLSGDVSRNEYRAAVARLQEARAEHRRYRDPQKLQTVPVMGGVRFRRFDEEPPNRPRPRKTAARGGRTARNGNGEG